METSAAKRATAQGPVFITDRGRPAFTLLKIEDCYRITHQSEPTFLSVMDSIPGGSDLEFDPQPVTVVTRNTQNFVDTGVALLNPWGPEH